MNQRTGKRARYSNGEIGRVKVVEDFLPPPKKLVRRKPPRKSRRA